MAEDTTSTGPGTVGGAAVQFAERTKGTGPDTAPHTVKDTAAAAGTAADTAAAAAGTVADAAADTACMWGSAAPAGDPRNGAFQLHHPRAPAILHHPWQSAFGPRDLARP